MSNSDKTSELVVEEMFQAGAHYGYSKTRRHPSAAPYIFATKNRTDIIDLEKTKALLDAAMAFIQTLAAKNKTVLLVGTKPEAKMAIEEAAKSLEMPYVTERWIGGTLSNFTEIKKRIAELENYKKENAEGGLEKYTKKERVLLAKKMEKLARYYTGLLSLKRAPDALFIIDPKAEHIAFTEARKSGIPVVALSNSDANLRDIDYPIVGNDAAIPSIKLFTGFITRAYQNARADASQSSANA